MRWAGQGLYPRVAGDLATHVVSGGAGVLHAALLPLPNPAGLGAGTSTQGPP